MAARVEQDLRPILVNLQKVSEEAARASAQAAAQVDRLDTLVSSLAWRVEDTAATIQQTVLQPFRDGLSLLGSLKSVIDGFREPRERREPRDVPPGSEAPPRPAAVPAGHPARACRPGRRRAVHRLTPLPSACSSGHSGIRRIDGWGPGWYKPTPEDHPCTEPSALAPWRS